jgi:hypothetical protein
VLTPDDAAPAQRREGGDHAYSALILPLASWSGGSAGA